MIGMVEADESGVVEPLGMGFADGLIPFGADILQVRYWKR